MISNIESLERLTAAVEKAGVDIAPDYDSYFRAANAIATDCGEAGRECFHRICRLSAKYRRKDADKIFTNMLTTNHDRVHLGTLFHLARQAGVETGEEAERGAKGAKGATRSDFRASAREGENTKETTPDSPGNEEGGSEEEELIAGSEPLQRLPYFPDYDWPEPLRTIISYGTTRAQRDILLLGGMTVLGATLGRKVRCFYDGRYLSPNFQTFIVAPPASGKGVLSFLRHLVAPLHEEMRRTYEAKMKEYQKERDEYSNAGKERKEKQAPEKPQNKMFLLAGNNTGTGLLQNIMDAGGEGLIFEVEADTLSTAIGSEYGRFSDTLRKAFDHERIAYNRRTDQEYRELDSTYISVLLSGTPAQVRPLIPNAENGLFSRQTFYYMPAVRQWRNMFESQKEDLARVFRQLGEEWKTVLDGLKPVSFLTLRLSAEQMDAFNARFATLFERASLANDSEMNSCVARLAVGCCRMLSVVAVLRGDMTPDADTPADNIKDGIVTKWDVKVAEEDFEAVMALVEPLYHHDNHILSFLPSTEVSRRTNSERDTFFASLPEVFTRRMVREKAAREQLKENTVISWLKRMVRQGKIEGTGTHGEYRIACARAREN